MYLANDNNTRRTAVYLATRQPLCNGHLGIVVGIDVLRVQARRKYQVRMVKGRHYYVDGNGLFTGIGRFFDGYELLLTDGYFTIGYRG
jgi:hypothetical protein